MVSESVRRGVITLWILLLIGFVPLSAGCSRSSQASTPRGTDIVVFVDFSASTTTEDRTLYQQAVTDQILHSLSAGDRLLIAPINDKTLTAFHPLVEATFPPKPEFNGWMDNVLRYNKQANEVDDQVAHLKATVRTQVDAMFAKRYTSQYTDVFSSLLIAKQLFHNQPRHKVLVLLSDMIEDYPPYRFERIAWSPDTNEKLLSELEKKGLIPDLSGVCIYVSGISAESADVAQHIGSFWQAYFQRTKADMDPSRYAHVLLHWPPSTSCTF
jgi:hypothetical protein